MPSPSRRRRASDKPFTVGHNRRAAQSARPPQPPGIELFIYSDNLIAAAFGFRITNGVLQPELKIKPFSVATGYKDLKAKISQVAAQHGHIDALIIPQSTATFAHSLQQVMPSGYAVRVATKTPNLGECCQARAIALSKGYLDESGYTGIDKLIEELRQYKADEHPSPLMWAYLLGIYELTLYSAWSDPKIKDLFFSASPPLF